MKSLRPALLSALAAFLTTASVHATVRTVSNLPYLPAQYSTGAAAVAASSAGDTLYFHGSPTSYGAVSSNKRLTIIGAGYYVTGSTFNYSTLLSVTLDSLLGTPVSGSRIYGVEGTISNTNSNIKDVVIERCKGTINSNAGWVIRHNIISTLNLYGGNLTIANNVIGVLQGQSSSWPGIVIVNNFFNAGSFIGVNNGVVANNIFYNTSFSSSGTGTTYTNNITYGTGAAVLPPANNTGSGNLSNTTPAMVNVPVPLVAGNIPTYDFTFSAGSAGINAGSDGTNIGPTGGPAPIAQFNRMPAIPQMQELNIGNGVINQGQDLNVQFKARKRN